MPKLYLLGGEDVKKKDSKRINKKAFADAGKKPTILIFPWTARIEKKKYRKPLKNYFKELGARKIIFAELSDSFKKIKKKIDSSDIIYLPGGETKFLVKRLKKIKKLLKNYKGVIIGNSAGTLSLCRKYAVIKGQDSRPKSTFESGLGLIDFRVSVHYGSPNLDCPSEDKDLKKLSKKVKIYAIPERSALVCNSKNLKIIGTVYQFYRGKKKKCQQ